MTTIKKKKPQSRCQCCSKRNTKIQRRYKGEAYCPNCYRTWFVPKLCHKCGETHRGYKKEDNSFCRKCIMNEPCIRCNSDAVENGANTKYGRVCQICYQGYFKPEKKCYECGEMKRNVSSYSLLRLSDYNHQICTTCYGKFFHSTCKICNRHRRVIEKSDGSKVCKKCSTEGLIPCTTCHKLMPAGIGKRCWDCYWQGRLNKEVEINSYLFNSKTIKKDYQEFTRYFSENKGSKTAKLKNNNFIEFFVRCDEVWGRIPSYQPLIEEFKPEGLRKNLTVLRWLIDSKRVVEDLEIKERVAEKERISALLERLGSLPKALKEYHQFLLRRQLERKTALKTIRMSLQPVVDIYNMFDLKGEDMPTQKQIDAYLIEKFGQYNSLYGFITFLSREYELSLICNQPSKADVDKSNRKKLEKQLIELANKTKALTAKEKLVWYQLSMAFFHNTTTSLKQLKTLDIKDAGEEMMVIPYNRHEYWVPKLK